MKQPFEAFVKLKFIFALILSTLPQAASADSFEKAIAEAKRAKLTEVNTVGEGVPFYSEKTLDPNWDENGSTPIVKLPALELIDQDGEKRTENLFDGKVSFVAFFFSSCAGFCPTFLKHLQKVEKRIKDRFPDTQFIAISVDPETDRPERLKSYFKRMGFNARSWKLLTGDRDRIYSLARDTFAGEAFQLPKSKGQIAHSEHFYVLDQKRRLRGVLKGTRNDVADSADALMTALAASPDALH